MMRKLVAKAWCASEESRSVCFIVFDELFDAIQAVFENGGMKSFPSCSWGVLLETPGCHLTCPADGSQKYQFNEYHHIDDEFR